MQEIQTDIYWQQAFKHTSSLRQRW